MDEKVKGVELYGLRLGAVMLEQIKRNAAGLVDSNDLTIDKGVGCEPLKGSGDGRELSSE